MKPVGNYLPSDNPLVPLEARSIRKSTGLYQDFLVFYESVSRHALTSLFGHYLPVNLYGCGSHR